MDLLEKLIQEQQAVSELAVSVRRVLRIKLQEQRGDWQEELRAEFEERIRPHFEFEEEHLFPVLVDVSADPAVSQLVDALKGEHRQVSERFTALLSEDSAAESKEILSQTLDVLLEHAKHEDEQLLPLVKQHADAIRAKLRDRKTSSEPPSP